MSPLAFVNHIVNLFVPALALAAVAATLAKLVWRGELRGLAWWRLAAWPAVLNAVLTVAGLAWAGRDGAMATYAAMVLGTAFALWWRGFRPGRR